MELIENNILIIFVAILIGSYYLGKIVAERSFRRQLPPCIIAKYKKNNFDNIPRDRKYLLKCELKYPQTVVLTNFVDNEIFEYDSLQHFLNDWDPVKPNRATMSGVLHFDKFGAPFFDERPQSYIKNLMNTYYHSHPDEYAKARETREKGGAPVVHLEKDPPDSASISIVK